MKRLFLIIASAIACMYMGFDQQNSLQADNRIIINDVTVPQGGMQELAVAYQLDKANAYVGYAFKLQMPEGVSTVKDEDGLPEFELDAENNRFNLTVTAADGFGALPKSTSVSISGTSGTLLTLKLKADASLTVGSTHTVTVNSVMLTEKTADGQMASVPLDDFTFTVTIGEPDDGRIKFYETATKLPSYTAGEKANVTMFRTIKAGEWSTLVLPFHLTKTNAEVIFGNDVQFAKFTGFEVDYGEDEENVTPLSITINLTNYSIPARGNMAGGTPVLIKTSKDIESFQLDNVTLVSSVNDATTADEYDTPGKLTGTLVKTKIPEDGLFISNNQFWYSTGKTNVKAFRCWFELGAVLDKETDFGARVTLHFDDSEASGISDASRLMNNEKVNNEVYDLMGRKVSSPQRKGLYVKDGKKVVINK